MTRWKKWSKVLKYSVTSYMNDPWLFQCLKIICDWWRHTIKEGCQWFCDERPSHNSVTRRKKWSKCHNIPWRHLWRNNNFFQCLLLLICNFNFSGDLKCVTKMCCLGQQKRVMIEKIHLRLNMISISETSFYYFAKFKRMFWLNIWLISINRWKLLSINNFKHIKT